LQQFLAVSAVAQWLWTSIFGWQTFPDRHLIYGWQVTKLINCLL